MFVLIYFSKEALFHEIIARYSYFYDVSHINPIGHCHLTVLNTKVLLEDLSICQPHSVFGRRERIKKKGRDEILIIYKR